MKPGAFGENHTKYTQLKTLEFTTIWHLVLPLSVTVVTLQPLLQNLYDLLFQIHLDNIKRRDQRAIRIPRTTESCHDHIRHFFDRPPHSSSGPPTHSTSNFFVKVTQVFGEDFQRSWCFVSVKRWPLFHSGCGEVIHGGYLRSLDLHDRFLPRILS